MARGASDARGVGPDFRHYSETGFSLQPLGKSRRAAAGAASAPRPPKPAEAARFREELCARLEALKLPKGRPVRLWVIDEMRHGLHSFTRRVWGLPGHRPVTAMQQSYQWGCVYGAVGLGLARREFLMAETVDQACLGRFYR